LKIPVLLSLAAGIKLALAGLQPRLVGLNLNRNKIVERSMEALLVTWLRSPSGSFGTNAAFAGSMGQFLVIS
jgi:hypothetical protein